MKFISQFIESGVWILLLWGAALSCFWLLVTLPILIALCVECVVARAQRASEAELLP